MYNLLKLQSFNLHSLLKRPLPLKWNLPDLPSQQFLRQLFLLNPSHLPNLLRQLLPQHKLNLLTLQLPLRSLQLK